MSTEWTPNELKTLKRLYPTKTTQEVAEACGRTLEATKRKAARMGLKKSAKYLKAKGRS